MAVYTKLEKKDIDIILEDYSIGNLEKFDPIEEGVENTNYKILVNKKKYILTIYEKRVDNKDLPFFCSLTTELFKKSFKCPLPIKNKKNEMISDYRNKKLTILSFIDGESKKYLSENDSYKIGLETSKLHALTNNIDLYRKNSLSIESWVKIYNQIKLAQKNKDASELKFIEDSLNQIKQNWPRDLPTGIIHGDIFIDNIIFQGENINGIIDYTFACNDFFAFDIIFDVNFSISSDNFFEVNGPVAITIMSSLKIFKDVISLLITLIYLLHLIFASMYFENISLSTASALPAGTLFLSAASIINELDNLSSS